MDATAETARLVAREDAVSRAASSAIVEHGRQREIPDTSIPFGGLHRDCALILQSIEREIEAAIGCAGRQHDVFHARRAVFDQVEQDPAFGREDLDPDHLGALDAFVNRGQVKAHDPTVVLFDLFQCAPRDDVSRGP